MHDIVGIDSRMTSKERARAQVNNARGNRRPIIERPDDSRRDIDERFFRESVHANIMLARRAAIKPSAASVGSIPYGPIAEPDAGLR